MAAILEQYPREDMRDGDLYWYNDVYASKGGVSQVNDTVFVMPVFDGDRLVAFTEAWGHLWDVGGTVSGLGEPACDQRIPRRHHDPAGAGDARRRRE